MRGREILLKQATSTPSYATDIRWEEPVMGVRAIKTGFGFATMEYPISHYL